jgi:hypothetical protein
MKHTLHMSAKDEAIKKTSEKTAADPKKAHKWIKKEELAAKKEKAKVKKLAEHKKAAHKPSSSHETKSQVVCVLRCLFVSPRPCVLGGLDAGVVLSRMLVWCFGCVNVCGSINVWCFACIN